MNGVRGLLERPETLILPGIQDALTASAAEQLGFDAVYIGGSTTAASRYALPDIGVVTVQELIDNAARIVDAVDVPVIADLDDGGGNPLQVQRAVRRAEQVGLAGFHIEDLDLTNGLHFLTNQSKPDYSADQLLDADAAVERVRAAVEARANPVTVIIGRTDAAAITSVEDAIYRARLFADVGADLVFVPHIGPSDVGRVVEAVSVPVMHCVGRHNGPSVAEREAMEEVGVKIVFYPLAVPSAAFAAARDALEQLRQNGVIESSEATARQRPEAIEAVGAAQWSDLARRYGLRRS